MNVNNEQASEFTFNEHEDYEKGFETVFKTQIIPILKPMKTRWIFHKL